MKITVTKHPKPILTAGIIQGDLFGKDSLWAYHPVVVKHNGRYLMVYTGKRIGRGIQHYTMLATSSDLITWKKQGDVLEKGSNMVWDSDFTAHGFFWKDRGTFNMLYDGSRTGDWLEEIGLAQSTDTRTWKKYAHNPVFSVNPESWWDWRHVSRCSVIPHKGQTYLFYAGHDGTRERIGIAVGKNCTSLKRMGTEPVLDVGRKGAWDEKSISDPRVISWKDTFLMFYSGIDAQGVERTGAAVSTDLTTWRKYNGNPVLDVSAHGWDSVSASRASVAAFDGKMYLFYSGKRKFFYHVGMAEVHIS